MDEQYDDYDYDLILPSSTSQRKITHSLSGTRLEHVSPASSTQGSNHNNSSSRSSGNNNVYNPLSSSTGGASLIEQLVHPPSNSLLCSICQDIFRDPVINPACSHSFCRACIAQAVKQSERCPLCRGPLKNDSVHPNLALAGLIRDLRAYCRFRVNGCRAELALEEKDAHEAQCPYAPFKCPQSGRGCMFTGTQQNVQEHLRSCPYEMMKGFLELVELKLDYMQRQVEGQRQEISVLKQALLLQGGGGGGGKQSQQQHQVGVEDTTTKMMMMMMEEGGHVDQVECKCIIPNAHQSGITALCPVPTSTDQNKYVLYSGSHDARIKAWSVDLTSNNNNNNNNNGTLGSFKQVGDVEAHKFTVWGLLKVADSLLSASADGNVLSWDLRTLQSVIQAFPISHPNAKIYCMTGADNTIFTGSADRTIRVWDLRASGPQAVLQGHTRSVWSLKLAPQLGGDVLLSAGNCGNINVWDLKTMKARLTMNHEDHEALSVECSPDGKHVFAGSSTAKIYAFDSTTGEMTNRLSGHQWEVWQLDSLYPKSKKPLLVSASYDHQIHLWSMEPPQFSLVKVLSGHKGVVHSVKVQDNLIFSGSGDKSIRVWGT